MPAVAAGPRHQPGRVEKSPFDRVPVCRSRIRALTVLVMDTSESKVVRQEGSMVYGGAENASATATTNRGMVLPTTR